MRHPDIMQPRKHPSWCGPAILSELSFRLQGERQDQEWFVNTLLPDLDGWGTNGDEMILGIGLIGLEAEWVRETLAQLARRKEQGEEVVLSWMSGPNIREDGHYALLECLEDGTIIVNDPEWIGMLKIMKQSHFEKIWFDIDEQGQRLEKWALVVRKP